MITYLPNRYNFGDNELPRVTINGRRHYMAEGVPLPSVTTVLGFKPKPEVAKWRARVGEAEADKISDQATYRGNQVHKICEDYVQTGKVVTKDMMPINVEQFFWIKEVLDQYLTEVYASEVSLYSLGLGIAGQVDMLGLWGGVKSVIDFKTSTRKKKEEWIENYFMQESLYGLMAYERSAANGEAYFAPQIVTVIATEETKQAEVFVRRAAPWLDKASKLVQEYQEFIVNGG
jgi:hypothetical protein